MNRSDRSAASPPGRTSRSERRLDAVQARIRAVETAIRQEKEAFEKLMAQKRWFYDKLAEEWEAVSAEERSLAEGGGAP
jgi:hypothetical protein